MTEQCNKCMDVYHFYEFAGKLEKSEKIFRDCAYMKEYSVICLPLLKLIEETPHSDPEIEDRYPTNIT